MASHLRTPPSPPRVEEVLAEIRHFRRCIREAGPEDCAARRVAQAAYAPFLHRRIKLLAALTGVSQH